jgi:deoxyribose-phosphate aldolase
MEAETFDEELARIIDHTLLRADATYADLDRLCDEARRFRFATVCVNSGFVGRARARLAGSEVGVCAVVGFPLGAMATAAKAYEARDAVHAGATEIDMVQNVGALRSGDLAAVEADIRAVVEASRPARVKVILETSALTLDEKVAAAGLARSAGAAFVKTSTGFGSAGATAEDVALLVRLVGDQLGVKASGGIHTRAEALRLVRAGATRLGASASVAIVTGDDAGSPGDE